jgi:SAM-dependent methyltransferase
MPDKFEPPGPGDFDRELAGISDSRLLPRLWGAAFGDEYPAELRVFSPTTWTDLRRIDQALALRPDQVLLDLGCGEGGPGLWLAARARARLIGVDFSRYAVGAAQRRAHEWLPDGRARFALGTFTATGLPDASVDAAVSFYGFIFCSDKPAGLAELRRVLRPGGRFALLVNEVLDAAEADGSARVADYRPLVTEAGLQTLTHEARTSVWEPMRRLYGLWLDHADELRAELGSEVSGMLIDEATQMGPRLESTRPLVLIGERPTDHL